MTLPNDTYMQARWAMNLEDLDREIARMAMVCQVRILDAGVIGRVLHDDASVCACRNERAFKKMRELLLVHFAILQKEADAIGQREAAGVEQFVLERLKKSFPRLAEP